ncbi:RICIN domain-containing protein [Actinotalea sp. BY-33]|uniref:RICIN domain-containing protein n=1 Tax=Actinotalea soli TaxID=2819234 RepID=A0A939LSB8_9CELL|nr:RICIN domain-containing protein [Actinotalea soli]MBO1750452.1 RICIN domain-containing protein [Actinotalea soli]
MITLTTPAARAARCAGMGRALRRDDSGMAMVTTLIAIMLTAMLSILLLGVLLSQLVPTSFARTSSQTVFAAEAGVNAVVGQIRTADSAPDVTNTVYGDTNKLPCTAEGPVGGADDGLRYAATIRYYLESPTGRSESWLASNAMGCTPGSGPTGDPTYALVTSEGLGEGVAGMAAGAGDRTVQVVYEFQITNNNIPGGLIYSYDRRPAYTPDRFCLEAESATVGALVKYVPSVTCGTDDVHQLWLYAKDYRIKLASTTVPGTGQEPLCVTGTPNGATPVLATLQVCVPDTSSSRWNQLFSWEGGAIWRGQQNPISGGYSNFWLSSGVRSDVVNGRYLYVWNQAASNNEWGSFNPDPRVGAGAAGIETIQIVNYLEFGRCFDVTDQDPLKAFMIVYPCKQDPSGGSRLNWNHKWYYAEPTDEVGVSAPQQIYVRNGGSASDRRCLVSPNVDGGYVTLTNACNAAANNQKWVRYANTGNYGDSYTFRDHWGRCISLGDKYDAWSKITVTQCNSGLGQKWNAPPTSIQASLDGYQEIP